MQRHPVDHPLDERDRLVVPGRIQQQAAPGEAGTVLNGDRIQMCPFRRRVPLGEHLPQADRPIEQARIAGRAHGHPVRTYVDGILFGSHLPGADLALEHDQRRAIGGLAVGDDQARSAGLRYSSDQLSRGETRRRIALRDGDDRSGGHVQAAACWGDAQGGGNYRQRRRRGRGHRSGEQRHGRRQHPSAEPCPSDRHRAYQRPPRRP